MSRFRTPAAAAAAAVALGLSLLAVVPAQAVPPSDEVVTIATGLDNPRQLSIGPAGTLYVAEAGSDADCVAIPGATDEFEYCGLTGSVTAVRGGEQ